MKISLIVPVYNVEPYLIEFLDSVANQTFNDFEAILVDDGSTDGSGAILDGYAQRLQMLRVIHKENGGVISAWKLGIQKSQGEYIAFADPDDILLPNMLATQYQLIKEHNADIVITGINRLTNDKLEKASADQWNLPEGLYEGTNLEKLKKNLFGNEDNPQTIFFFWKPNKLFKRNILINNLDYSKVGLSFGEDVCVSASAIYDAERLYYSHEPLYVYRIRDNSLTTVKFNTKQIDDAYHLIDSVRCMVSAKGYMTDFIYYNDPSYHIMRLMRKIKNTEIKKNEKLQLFKYLKYHRFLTEYNLKKAKKFISYKRYIAIWLLKHSRYSLLLRIL